MLTRHRTIASLSLIGLLAGFGFSSCAPPEPPPQPPRASHVMYEWYDEPGPGEVSIRIDLRSQIATVRRGPREIGWCYVATGRDGHGTPAGTYRVTEKVVDKISNRWGWHEDEFGEVVTPSARIDHPVPRGARFKPAPMPYWMRLTNWGIGMHGGVIPNPGSPASAGCIRLPEDFAPILYQQVKIGTPVTITR